MNDIQWYKLIFKQIQPIHVGMGSFGVVNETRIFIPGWTMWGALTKAYNLKNNFLLSENQDLFENISCFYPAFKSDANYQVLFPIFKNGEFSLGEYSEDKFRAKFVDTFMSTAISSLSNTALDDHLHELNVILPGVKEGFKEKDEEYQLYWIGIIKIDDVKKIPSEIYVGGEVKYGLGKLVLETQPEKEEFNSWIKDEDSNTIRNYWPVVDNKEGIEGKIELLVEVDKPWERAELNVKLQEVSNNEGFFYVPGSKVEKVEGKFSINKGLIVEG